MQTFLNIVFVIITFLAIFYPIVELTTALNNKLAKRLNPTIPLKKVPDLIIFYYFFWISILLFTHYWYFALILCLKNFLFIAGLLFIKDKEKEDNYFNFRTLLYIMDFVSVVLIIASELKYINL